MTQNNAGGSTFQAKGPGQKMVRYAAIDIGSNAVRLLLSHVVEEKHELHFNKSELVRIPLRLGDSVFETGAITQEAGKRFAKTMLAFKLLIDVYNPVAYRACATAAMREAANGTAWARKVKRECGLAIEIISGKEEAEILYANHFEKHLDNRHAYLYIDVGGGSTELTLFDNGVVVNTRSFDIGTLRWMKDQVPKPLWTAMKKWVEKNTRKHRSIIAIGSGGNINKMHKMVGRKDKPLGYPELRALYDELKTYSVTGRIHRWALNPDRADVIVPAAKTFLGVMKAGNIDKIIVPQIGLVDGIVHLLHEQAR